MPEDAITRRHLAALRSLPPVFRWRVEAVLRDLSSAGYQPVVWEGTRTVAQQADKVKKGYSKTMASWHVPSTFGELGSGNLVTTVHGAAADIVDRRWRWQGPCANKNHPFWIALGRIAKAQGLEWGGDWRIRDVAHVQLRYTDMRAHPSALA